MHLTLIISSLSAGGAERVLSELANYWAAKGHRISLLTLVSPETQPFYLLHPKIKLVQLDQSQAGASLFTRFQNILKRVFCLRKTVRNLKPDMIVSFIDVMNVTTLIATWGLKIPVIISERIDPHFHRIPRLYTWLRFKIYPFCNKLIIQTNSSANYFPSDFKRFIQIIPNPVVSVSHNIKKISGKVQNIITVGRLDKQKDHMTLIRSFSELLKGNPELCLTIYGEGKERNKLEELVNSLGLSRKVFLPGMTQNIYKVLVEADLFIFPSLYEGFPNALCEAMSVGLPVIASNCSGNIEVVQDRIDGRLFPVGNIQVLTSITLELLDDLEQRQRLGKHAQEIGRRFHPDRIFALWDHVVLKSIMD